MSNWRSPLGTYSFCVACIAFCLAVISRAQEAGEKLLQSGEKLVIANEPVQITDAVMITDISVAGKSVECGLFVKPPAVAQPITPFQAPDDWLKTMTISLINRTAKNIVAGQIALDFLDTGDCRIVPCAVENIQIGHVPSVDAYDGRTGKPLKPEHPERPALVWKPSQTIPIHVVDYMDEIEKNLESRFPPTDVTKVSVHPSPFFFEDGMRAVGQYYSVPDPDRPGKYKYLPQDYFPGRRALNWPPGYDSSKGVTLSYQQN